MSNFPSDSPFAACIVPSPNHDERKGIAKADMLLLHYTGMADTEAALTRLTDAAAKVSSHYFVFEDGRVAQLVPEARRAWHAGVSSWQGESDINSCSVGIEIANPGHDFGYPDFPDVQIDAVIALCRDIVGRVKIPPARVLAHSDVAPSRKNDPGEKFPWGRLSDAGVGLWLEPTEVIAGPELVPGDHSEVIATLQQELAEFGYGIEPTGRYDTATQEVVTAFQRHFRPRASMASPTIRRSTR